MEEQASFKNKLLILLILSIAAGLISIAPINNIQKKDLVQKSPNDQEKNNKNLTKCNYDKELSSIVANQNEENAPNSCLYMGCGGFIY